MSAYIRWLIAQKQKWHHPPDPAEIALGFRGWHTRGYLPHFDAPGIIQMINFHLADSLPQERQHEWRPLMGLQHERTRRIRLEEYLDRGYGQCELAIPVIAQGLEDILLRDDGHRCRLLAWVIMPNHVHILVEMWTTPLSKLVQSWKKLATNLANKHLQRSGQFWQEDYFDRYIRDQDHFQKAVHYIEKNPLKAKLVSDPKKWGWSSAKWRPEGLGLQSVQKPKPPEV